MIDDVFSWHRRSRKWFRVLFVRTIHHCISQSFASFRSRHFTWPFFSSLFSGRVCGCAIVFVIYQIFDSILRSVSLVLCYCYFSFRFLIYFHTEFSVMIRVHAALYSEIEMNCTYNYLYYTTNAIFHLFVARLISTFTYHFLHLFVWIRPCLCDSVSYTRSVWLVVYNVLLGKIVTMWYDVIVMRATPYRCSTIRWKRRRIIMRHKYIPPQTPEIKRWKWTHKGKKTANETERETMMAHGRKNCVSNSIRMQLPYFVLLWYSNDDDYGGGKLLRIRPFAVRSTAINKVEKRLVKHSTPTSHTEAHAYSVYDIKYIYYAGTQVHRSIRHTCACQTVDHSQSAPQSVA